MSSNCAFGGMREVGQKRIVFSKSLRGVLDMWHLNTPVEAVCMFVSLTFPACPRHLSVLPVLIHSRRDFALWHTQHDKPDNNHQRHLRYLCAFCK